MKTEHKLPTGFHSPTDIPEIPQRESWQSRNQSWWEQNPMRYDWNDRIALQEFSREFFDEIDKRFFEDAERYMPARMRPFDQLIPFDNLPQYDVLEIGVGNGSHAQLLAPHCKSFTGIDLTAYAVDSTTNRFQLYDLPGRILRMDAENQEFPDASFDFIWTWGVIHHSANTEQILSEMNRVLRPGGSATIMVYHRSILYFYIFNGFFRGVLGGGLLKANSLHELVQLHTDGAIARFYRPAEWKELVERVGFVLEGQQIRGQKSELFPLPAGQMKNLVMNATPNALVRFVTNSCRQGSFLITTVRKP